MSDEIRNCTVADRIQRASACDVINLTPEELDIYCGAGRKLARFSTEGKLIELFDPLDVADEMLTQTQITEWIMSAEGEVWLVMCSCTQLCEPRRIVSTSATDLAHVARVFGEEWVD